MCKQLWHSDVIIPWHFGKIMHLSNIISKSLLYLKKEKKNKDGMLLPTGFPG